MITCLYHIYNTCDLETCSLIYIVREKGVYVYMCMYEYARALTLRSSLSTNLRMEAQTLLQTKTLLVSSFNPLPKNSLPVIVKSPARVTTRRRQVYASASPPKREKDPKKRVVVTGMGLVSVFGNNVDTYYDRLLAGENGITLIDKFDASKLPTRFGGQIGGFNSDGYVDAKIDRRLDDCQRYCIVAGKRALKDAALGGDEGSKVYMCVCMCDHSFFHVCNF